MDWFLYDNGPRHERVKVKCLEFIIKILMQSSWKVKHTLLKKKIHIIKMFKKSNWKLGQNP